MTLGTKRLASEEFVHEWDNKRLNSGYTIEPQKPNPGFEQVVGSHTDVKIGAYASYAAVSSVSAPNWQEPIPFSYQATVPALVGKGAKQWRDGDWMCTNCNNHNYASECCTVLGVPRCQKTWKYAIDLFQPRKLVFLLTGVVLLIFLSQSINFRSNCRGYVSTACCERSS